MHGNLKPANVLLAADGIPRVTDFRPTGGLFQGPLPAADGDGTGLGYLAPEFARDPSAEARPQMANDLNARPTDRRATLWLRM